MGASLSSRPGVWENSTSAWPEKHFGDFLVDETLLM